MYVEPVKRELRKLQAAFPKLTMQIDAHPPFDFLARFLRQPGLTFDIALEMDSDELHISVDQHLVLELWTHNHPERIAAAIDDIRGLLTGEYRVVVYREGGTVVGTDLETPGSNGWAVVAGWWDASKMAASQRQKLSTQVLHNATAPKSDTREFGRP